MADYQLTASEMVIRTSDVVWIPNDPGNRDRAEYDAWLAAGGVPDPYKQPFTIVPYDMGPDIAERLGVSNGSD